MKDDLPELEKSFKKLCSVFEEAFILTDLKD